MPTAPVSERFTLSPFPSGWFRVANSADVKPGEAIPGRYFGQDLVIYRGMSGKAHVMNATCPHLGAHLGIGGTVQGEQIVCPFHGWRYASSGECTHAPRAKKVPKAHIRAWHVTEVNEQIMVWHHKDGIAPTWDMPALEEVGKEGWLPLQFAYKWTIHTHVQELAENAMDVAHFTWLHPHLVTDMHTSVFETDGATLQHVAEQKYSVFGFLKHLNGSNSPNGPLDATLHGLGVVVNRAQVKSQGVEMAYCYPFFVTPIDEERIEATSYITVRKMPGLPFVAELIRWKAAREGKITIEQDIPIWEHKRFQHRPRLSDADGPIMKYRKWARQFYETVEPSEAATAS